MPKFKRQERLHVLVRLAAADVRDARRAQRGQAWRVARGVELARRVRQQVARRDRRVAGRARRLREVGVLRVAQRVETCEPARRRSRRACARSPRGSARAREGRAGRSSRARRRRTSCRAAQNSAWFWLIGRSWPLHSAQPRRSARGCSGKIRISARKGSAIVSSWGRGGRRHGAFGQSVIEVKPGATMVGARRGAVVGGRQERLHSGVVGRRSGVVLQDVGRAGEPLPNPDPEQPDRGRRRGVAPDVGADGRRVGGYRACVDADRVGRQGVVQRDGVVADRRVDPVAAIARDHLDAAVGDLADGVGVDQRRSSWRLPLPVNRRPGPVVELLLVTVLPVTLPTIGVVAALARLTLIGDALPPVPARR